jgi:serine/threonine protein kinase
VRVCPRCRSIYSAQVDRCPSDGERVAEEHTYPLIGETLDRYRFAEPIGEGAMGCVYRATHNVLPREYAIKVLFKDLASNQTLIERFRREAQAMSTISHPNIVNVADFVTAPNGMTFIVMELVPGRTLDLVIAREAPFAPIRAARIARQIAAGLGEAHRMGFVHRDVKPSNIMLTDAVGGQELVKILDFGVVGLGAMPMSSRLTAIGHIIGTPTYMAPEQVHDPAVGPAADLYALGVILFEMLAGEPPFTGPGRTEVFIKHISELPPPLPASDGLELLAAWLLEKHPERRPKSAEDVIHAIDRLGIVPEHKIESPRKAQPVFEAHNSRPLILDPELAMSLDEGDTFEPDTDSAIPKDQINRALEEETGRPDHRRPEPRDTDPERAVNKPSSTGETEGVEPVVYEDKTPKKRRPGSSDEMFPSLAPISSGANDWTSWNPDGIFEPMALHDQPMRLDRPDTIPVPTITSEGPTTDPLGHAPLILPGDEAEKDPKSTHVVRNRTRPKVQRTPVPDIESQDSTDLVLYEPDLPNEGGDRTQRNPVDDGPTQVDFVLGREAISGETPIPGATPVILPGPSASVPEPAESQRDTEAVPVLTKEAIESTRLASSPVSPLKPVDIPAPLSSRPPTQDPDMIRGDTLIKEISTPQLEATLLHNVDTIYAETMPDKERRKDVVIIRTSSLPAKLRRIDVRIAIGVLLIIGFALLLGLAIVLR